MTAPIPSDRIKPPAEVLSEAEQAVYDELRRLTVSAHEALLAERCAPMDGAAAAIVAAIILAIDVEGMKLEDVIPAARVAWRGRETRRDVRANSDRLAIVEEPSEALRTATERLLFVTQQFQAREITAKLAVGALMGLGAAWAGSSLAVTEGRFVEAVRHAEERRGRWFEVVPNAGGEAA